MVTEADVTLAVLVKLGGSTGNEDAQHVCSEHDVTLFMRLILER